MNMIDVVDGLDLSGVPIPFLEAYPYPAFVLALPVGTRALRPKFISRDTDATVRHYDDAISPLHGPAISPMSNVSSVTVAWSNERWLQVTEGRSLDEVLDSLTQHRLQSWISAEDTEEDSIFHLQMRDPALSLHLSKTMLPLTPPSTTHAFCIVTSQARPRSLSSSASDSTRPFGNTRPSTSTERTSLSTDRGSTSTERTSLSFPSSASQTAAGSNDGYFPPLDPQSNQQQQQRRGIRARGMRDPLNIQHLVTVAEDSWALLESFDWSKTKLGPMEQWADTIGPLLSTVFQSRTMDCIWLGEDLQLIYNKTYSHIVDHPNSFGQPGAKVWASIWDYIGPLTESALAGVPVYRDDDLLVYKKYAGQYDLETYFTWRYVPISRRDGTVIGFFNQAIDATDKVLAERRLGTIRSMSEQLMVARTTTDYYDSVAEVFEQNPRDAPFMMCYSVSHVVDTESDVINVEAKLERTVGVPEIHPSAQSRYHLTLPARSRGFGPNTEHLSSPTLSAISALSSGSGRHYHTSSGTSWPIKKALASRQCVVVEDCRDLIQGFPIRAWDELPFAAVVVPICSDTTSGVPDCVIILGLNSRRPLDADYDGWLQVLRAQLASSLISVKASEAEKQRIDDAIKMERAKSAWFRGAAHDLRSPLTLINGPIEDLLHSDLKPGQRNQLITAKSNVDRLLRLVNALMDFSRLEAGRVEGKFVPIDFGTWVENLAELFRSATERMGITFILEIPEEDRAVYVDPTLFETIVSNLISNALKYTVQGQITIKVSYTDWAEVAVIDTGVGIPEDEVPHVTDWYHRASTAVHSGAQGSGLGLALVKELLRLHDGELLVSSKVATESDPSHGSVFTARVPLESRQTSSEVAKGDFGAYGKAIAREALRWVKAPGTEGSSEAGGSESLNDSGSGSKISDTLLFEPTDVILLVDDNYDMRAYIKNIFSRHCKVVEASNGEEALAMVESIKPNLVLSDVMMPRVNGLEMLAELRNRPATRLIPVVLLSAMQGDEARVEALMMGAEDYIEKPFKPRELLARVHLHLQVGKKRAKLEQEFAEREARIAVIADYCPSGILGADASGKVTYSNDAWRKMIGMAPDEDVTNWVKYATAETLQNSVPLWNQFVNGDQKEAAINWKWKNGVSTDGVFVRLDLVKDHMTGILGCIADVTYREERLRDAEERRREAEESRHQQELLIDLTSHEIRTPVSAILQCSSLVKENLIALKDQLRWAGSGGFKPSPELLEDLEEDVEALESIYQCGLVQERIAGDVLSLARIQLDMLSLHDVESDFRKEAKKILSVFAAEARMKKIELALEFGESIEASKCSGIKTDPVRLGQVVTNLISNAIRFTASSHTRKITTTYNLSFTPPAEGTCALPSSIGLPETLPPPEDTPVWLFVSVRDTGPGLGPAELALLFKRFSQGNKMIHTRYGGSGLGLFICKKITELLGGRIEVQSELGEGSVFRFFIKSRTVCPPSPLAVLVASTDEPRRDSCDTPTSGSRPLSVASSVSPRLMSENDWSEYHILIVEDNIINQTVLKRQLQKAGLTCDVADNGLEALNLIREADRQAKRGGANRRKMYSAVLMDLEMPIMDGLTAVREIRKAERAGTLGRHMVIALTGNARQGQIDQAMEAGMDDVVIKPYKLGNLLQKIRSMAAKREELERSEE